MGRGVESTRKWQQVPFVLGGQDCCWSWDGLFPVIGPPGDHSTGTAKLGRVFRTSFAGSARRLPTREIPPAVVQRVSRYVLPFTL